MKAEFRTSGNTLTKRVELEYDIFDRLILKRLDNNGNGTWDLYEKFVYDGNNVALAFVDLDGQGSSDDYTLSNRYLHGPAVDQLMADEQFDAAEDLIDTYGTLGDNLGSIRDIANYTPGTDSTAVVNHRAFDSFGELLSETSAAPTTRFYFTGRYFDHDLQLQYNHHRWYDPQQRGWMTKDPITFAAGDTNLSRMVGNSVTNFTDPSGLVQYDFSKRETWRLFGPMYFQTEEGREWYRQMTEYAQANPGNGWSEGADGWLDQWLGTNGWGGNAAEWGGPVEWLGGKIYDVAGPEYLAGAGDWELFWLTAGGVTIGVVGGYAGASVASSVGLSGASAAGFAGGVGGAAEYTFVAGSTYIASDGAAPGLTWGGLSDHVGAGATIGVIIHAGGNLYDLLTGNSGPNCFVAGTQVVVGVEQTDSAAQEAFAQDDNWLAWRNRIAGIVFVGAGLAVRSLKNRGERKKWQRRHELPPGASTPRRMNDGKHTHAESLCAGLRDQQQSPGGGSSEGQSAAGAVVQDRTCSLRTKAPHLHRAAGSAMPRRRASLAAAGVALCFLLAAWFGFRGFVTPDSDGSVRRGDDPKQLAEARRYITKNIEDIQKGDLVLARDEHGHEIGYRRVVRVFHRTSDHLRVITLADGHGARQTLETTDEHPFWSVTRDAWIDAGELQVDEKVTGPSGEILHVASTTFAPHPEGIRVYNFEVEGAHTYYVAARGTRAPPVLVHNADYRHYTNDAGKEAITESGALREGTYVTKPGEIPPSAGHKQIEGLLEIGPGKGSNYIDIDVPETSVGTPPDGPHTSGGAWQGTLDEPIPIDPGKWKRPPGRPANPVR